MAYRLTGDALATQVADKLDQTLNQSISAFSYSQRPYKEAKKNLEFYDAANHQTFAAARRDLPRAYHEFITELHTASRILDGKYGGHYGRSPKSQTLAHNAAAYDAQAKGKYITVWKKREEQLEDLVYSLTRNLSKATERRHNRVTYLDASAILQTVRDKVMIRFYENGRVTDEKRNQYFVRTRQLLDKFIDSYEGLAATQGRTKPQKKTLKKSHPKTVRSLDNSEHITTQATQTYTSADIRTDYGPKQPLLLLPPKENPLRNPLLERLALYQTQHTTYQTQNTKASTKAKPTAVDYSTTTEKSVSVNPASSARGSEMNNGAAQSLNDTHRGEPSFDAVEIKIADSTTSLPSRDTRAEEFSVHRVLTPLEQSRAKFTEQLLRAAPANSANTKSLEDITIQSCLPDGNFAGPGFLGSSIPLYISEEVDGKVIMSQSRFIIGNREGTQATPPPMPMPAPPQVAYDAPRQPSWWRKYVGRASLVAAGIGVALAGAVVAVKLADHSAPQIERAAIKIDKFMDPLPTNSRAELP